MPTRWVTLVPSYSNLESEGIIGIGKSSILNYYICVGQMGWRDKLLCTRVSLLVTTHSKIKLRLHEVKIKWEYFAISLAWGVLNTTILLALYGIIAALVAL